MTRRGPASSPPSAASTSRMGASSPLCWQTFPADASACCSLPITSSWMPSPGASSSRTSTCSTEAMRPSYPRRRSGPGPTACATIRRRSATETEAWISALSGSTARLPVDHPDAPRDQRHARATHLALDSSVVAGLDRLRKTYRMRLDEVLLSGLARALVRLDEASHARRDARTPRAGRRRGGSSPRQDRRLVHHPGAGRPDGFGRYRARSERRRKKPCVGFPATARTSRSCAISGHGPNVSACPRCHGRR